MRQETRSVRAIALSIGIIVGVFIVVLLVARGFSVTKPKADTASITLEREGRKITVSVDGSVFENDVLVDTWSAEKTRAFFDYYNSQYADYKGGEIAIIFSGASGTSSSTVPAGDELTEIIFNGGGGNGGGGNGGGGDTGGIFDTETPTPTPLPYGSSPPLPSPAPSWCQHWLLSYCADTPTPSSTPTPTPGTGPTPLPPDCNNVGNQQTGRTVISNDLCIPTSTP